MFYAQSPEKELQNKLLPATLYVVAQAARQKETVTFSQIQTAVVAAMQPGSQEDAGRMANAVADIFKKRVLVREGLATYARGLSEEDPGILNITQRGMAFLGRRCADMIPMPDLRQEISVSENGQRVTEADLVVPILALLVKMNEESGLPVKMTDLREGTKRMLEISPEDLDPLDSRSDQKIDQVLRNAMRPTRPLRKQGLVLSTDEGYVPSQKGLALLAEEYLKILPSPNFAAMDDLASEVGIPANENVSAIRPRMRRR